MYYIHLSLQGQSATIPHDKKKPYIRLKSVIK